MKKNRGWGKNGWWLLKVSKSKIAKPVDVDDYGSVAGKHYNKGKAPEIIFEDSFGKVQVSFGWIQSSWFTENWKLLFLSLKNNFQILCSNDFRYGATGIKFERCEDSWASLTLNLKSLEP